MQERSMTGYAWLQVTGSGMYEDDTDTSLKEGASELKRAHAFLHLPNT